MKNTPGRDGTGPWGAGPMTGRGAGYCAVYLGQAYTYPVHVYYRVFGKVRGRGYDIGWGRTFGRGWYKLPPTVFPPVNPQVYVPTTQPQFLDEEATALENYQKHFTAEKANLEQELEGVKARIEELKTKLEQITAIVSL